MNLPAAILAAFGLGLAMYAAMETEPEERFRRATCGILGIAMLGLGVACI